MGKRALLPLGVVFLFSCAVPQQTVSNKKLARIPTVKGVLKAVKAEYFDLSPTETFAIMSFKNDQLNLNAWCLQKGGTPYYCYRDSFGDKVCSELVDKDGTSKYAGDLYEKPDERYVVCKKGNDVLYTYRAYVIGTGYRNTAGWKYIGFLIEHKPEKEDYNVESMFFKVPKSSLSEMDYTKCNGKYCRSVWFLHRRGDSFFSFGNMLATYLYCKYTLGGRFYKGREPFEEFFKEVFLKEGAAGKIYDRDYSSKVEGFYYCIDGDKSFKVKVTFERYFEGTARFRALYKIDPSLKNKRVSELKEVKKSVSKAEVSTPNAFSSFEEIALYVAKTGQPFSAKAGGVLVMATPVREGSCTLVSIKKFVNGPLVRSETVKVCNGRVVKSSDTHPAVSPKPQNLSALSRLIPDCQAYGSSSLEIGGYTVECRALDRDRCNLQIVTRQGDKVLDVKEIRVCNK